MKVGNIDVKYILINKNTGENHLCKKTTIDGFDLYYYVGTSKLKINVEWYVANFGSSPFSGPVIATNNPKIGAQVLNGNNKSSKEIEVIYYE
jgi:hypothetical protein